MKLINGRAHDLPASWDGKRVTWSEWIDIHVWICPPPSGGVCCPHCGSRAVRASSSGAIHPEPGETFSSTRTRKTKRTGRAYDVAVEVPAWPVMRFTAFRCPDCLVDDVHDVHTGEVWTLDESDYGPEGSAADTLF